MFNYGGLKLFFIKILFGILFSSFSLVLFLSLISYNLNDPGFNKLSMITEVSNLMGYSGAVLSSLMMVFVGHQSYTIGLFLLFIGIRLCLGMLVNRIILKIFLLIFSTVFVNLFISSLNIDAYNLGLISLFFITLIDLRFLEIVNNVYLSFLLNILSLMIGVIITIYCFSIKLSIFKKIISILKIFKLIINFILIERILFFLKKTKNSSPKNIFIKNEPTLHKNKKNLFRSSQKNNNLINNLHDINKYTYALPSNNHLAKSQKRTSYKKEVEYSNQLASKKLEKILLEYGVEGKIVNFKTGPIVTLFEFIPRAGIKASKVIGLSEDIARAMSSLSARISSQPGKASLGIEIPNSKRESVMFGDLIEDEKFEELDNSLTLALGKDISGDKVFTDLEKMPHLLIAGTTGSGKSVGINTMILSLIYRFKPNECKLILIDPKMLELSIYEDIPHLLTPVVTNPNKAVFALKWVVQEMENRYKLMSSLNVKNIQSYNEKIKKTLEAGKRLYREVQTGVDSERKKPIIEKREIPLDKMPFIVVVIDEMADLMMVAGKEVENLVQRLAQMARASGIHLITATQRPSVDVITGTIKANFPSRISYKVASKFDSRTILNEMGAEQLLGSGDMLFLENGANLKRLHGGFVSENEIEKVVRFVKEQGVFDHNKEILIEEKNNDGSMAFKFEKSDVDDLYKKAVEIVVSQQKVSTSYIQRYLQIGYNRAARIVEKMEEDGIISEANNAGKRQVLKQN